MQNGAERKDFAKQVHVKRVNLDVNLIAICERMIHHANNASARRYALRVGKQKVK